MTSCVEREIRDVSRCHAGLRAPKTLTHPSRDLILMNTNEIHALIEMLRTEMRFLDHSMRKFPLEIHHQMKHLIVGTSGKEDLARVEFVERASDRPDVECLVVG